jgi:hypothetical protein
VTASEKPSRNGHNGEPEAERTAVLAGEEPTTDKPIAGTDLFEPAGKEESHATVPASASASAEERELAHTAPPPWQRMPDSPYARSAPPPPPGPPEAPADDSGDTIRVEMDRPVVTGTAAGRVFEDTAAGSASGRVFGDTDTDADVRTPPEGIPSLAGYHPPPRTTTHLDGGPVLAGPNRPITGASAPNVLRRPGRGPRRANLQIKRFDPWSVLKLSLVLGVALFFVWLVAVGALYAVLDGMGVWDKINGLSTDLLQANASGSEPLISAGRVFGIAAIVGAVNIVLFSALATVGAFVYNVSADLAGGLEVTLAERE